MNAPLANALHGAPQISRERFSRLAALIIILAGLAAYANTLSNAFVFDDIDSIVSNAVIRRLWPLGKFFRPLNRPVVTLTLAVNYAIGGLNVASYHAFNIAVHILAALTLYGLVRRTLTLPRLRARFGDAAIVPALATALIWEVHPLQTESVTYIIQRAESLAGLFCLLTLYCVARGALSDRPLRWYAAAFAACALGMGTKQTVAAAPLAIFLYDWIFLSGSFLDALRRRWPVYLALAATWLLLIPSASSAFGQKGLSVGFLLHVFTPMQYARTELGVILHYLELSFWPAGLCLDYYWPRADALGQILPGAIVVGALVATTAAALALRPMWGFLGAWFFLILAPTSSIMPITDAAAERRMYLPLAAVVAFVVIGACALLRRRAEEKGAPARAERTWPAVAVLLIVVALGALTARRNRVYRSEFSVWDDTVQKAPNNPRAYNGRGAVFCGMGKLEAALDDYRKAIALEPTYFAAYDGRAIVYIRMGKADERRYDDAIRDCDEAIALKPDLAVSWDTRAVAYSQKRDYEAAFRDFATALRLSPDYAAAYYNRGNAYGRKGERDRAIADYNRAIEKMPDYAEAYCNRGNMYSDKGDFDRAIADYTQAIALKRDYRDAYYNRAVACYYKKEYRQAWADVQAALNLGGEPMPAMPKFLRALTQAAPPD
jgi:tetratricopeptide (TPR) repeat protein